MERCRLVDELAVLDSALDLSQLAPQKSREALLSVAPKIMEALDPDLNEADRFRLNQVVEEVVALDAADKNLVSRTYNLCNRLLSFAESNVELTTTLDHLENLRWQVRDLNTSYKAAREGVKSRAKMLARRCFGADTPYINEISAIDFERLDKNGDIDGGNFFSERDRMLLLVDTMVEEIRMEKQSRFQAAGSFGTFARDVENSSFTREEQLRVAIAIEEVKQLIEARGELTESIKRDLDELAEAPARDGIGKKDWQLMFLTWVLSKGLDHVLKPETVSAVFTLISDRLHSLFDTMKMIASHL